MAAARKSLALKTRKLHFGVPVAPRAVDHSAGRFVPDDLLQRERGPEQVFGQTLPAGYIVGIDELNRACPSGGDLTKPGFLRFFQPDFSLLRCLALSRTLSNRRNSSHGSL